MARLQRDARRHKAGVDTTAWWQFQPGQRVQTIEGFPGVVTAVEDGPYPGSEQYEVALDGGLGGGAYSSSELRAVDPTLAAVTSSVTTTFTDQGQTGNRTHITMEEHGTLPTWVIADLLGVMGETPGAHRNKQGAAWEDFKADIAANGITNPIFITVDWGQPPKISEGNHRRDAAVEEGLAEVPVQIRYFGNAQDQGTVLERAERKVAVHYAQVDLADPESGEQEVRDLIEGKEITHAGVIVKAADSGRLLLCQRTPYEGDDEGTYGRWEFPGGSLDDGEDPIDGAFREFSEETGLDLPDNARIVGGYRTGGWLGIIVLVAHEAWTVSAELLDFEVMGLGWFHPDDIEGTDIIRKEMADAKWDMIREALRKSSASGGVCVACGYNLPHHAFDCPRAPKKTFYCPSHVPAGATPVPYDDGRGKCSVCGVYGGHVRPFLGSLQATAATPKGFEKLTCDDCGATFFVQEHLDDHKATEHGDDDDPKGPKKESRFLTIEEVRARGQDALEAEALEDSQHTAADDYPELGTILVERPNHQHAITGAKKPPVISDEDAEDAARARIEELNRIDVASDSYLQNAWMHIIGNCMENQADLGRTEDDPTYWRDLLAAVLSEGDYEGLTTEGALSATAANEFISWCKVCGTRIQRNGSTAPWRHQRPQPSGAPWDHNAVPGGEKTADKDPRFEGIGLKQDDDGKWYVTTHRARSKSYDTPEDIPQSEVDFIESTGALGETTADIGDPGPGDPSAICSGCGETVWQVDEGGWHAADGSLGCDGDVQGHSVVASLDKKIIASFDGEGRQVEAGFFDKVVDRAADSVNSRLPESSQYETGHAWSYDWCRFRRNSRCMYPAQLNAEATKEAGYAVWVPQDRGLCPRVKWADQKVCPVAEPGPHSGDPNALTDATIPWEQGGQHGGFTSAKTAVEGTCKVCGAGADFIKGPLLYAGPPGNRSESFVHSECSHATPKAAGAVPCPGSGSDPLPMDVNGDERTTTITPENMGPVVHHFSEGYGVCPECHFVKRLSASGRLPKHTRYMSWADQQRPGSLDSEFRFHVTASWKDVRAKATRIRSDGGVRIISAPGPNNPYITAEVRGDTNIYRTTLLREPGKKSIASWECGCAWSAYSWGRSGRWKRFEGRLCSHALATAFEAQAQEMFGGTIKEQYQTPPWRMDTTIPVIQPGDYKTAPHGPWRVGSKVDSMHPVSTDASLNAPPIVEVVKAMLETGQAAGEVMAFVASLVGDPEAIMVEALRGGTFRAKVKGWVRNILGIDEAGLVLIEDGSKVQSTEVFYPTYDPRLGLDLADSVPHVSSLGKTGLAIDTTGNADGTDGLVRQFAVTPVGDDFFAGEADDLSRSYRDMPLLDPAVAFLWIELGTLMLTQAQQLANQYEIVRHDDIDPYMTAEEMHADIDNGRYQVTSLHSHHQVWDPDINVAFRTVHDLLGHHVTRSDFSFRGEVEAYQNQCKVTPEHLWPVLFSEIVAQSAYCNTHHLFGEQKVGLIPLTQAEIDAHVGAVMDAPDAAYDALRFSASKTAISDADLRRNRVDYDPPLHATVNRTTTVTVGWGIYMHSQDQTKVTIPSGDEVEIKASYEDTNGKRRYIVVPSEHHYTQRSGDWTGSNDAVVSIAAEFLTIHGTDAEVAEQATVVTSPSNVKCPASGLHLASNYNDWNVPCPICGAQNVPNRKGNYGAHKVGPDFAQWAAEHPNWEAVRAAMPAKEYLFYLENNGQTSSGRQVYGSDSPGVMVALVPPVGMAEALASLGSESADKMHVTLSYLGKAPDIDVDLLHETVASFARGMPTLTGIVAGFGGFLHGGEDGNVLYASMDIPNVQALKVALDEALGAVGIAGPNNHGFTPHMTLAYVDGPVEIPTEVPMDLQGTVAFHDLVVAVGDDWTHYPLQPMSFVFRDDEMSVAAAAEARKRHHHHRPSYHGYGPGWGYGLFCGICGSNHPTEHHDTVTSGPLGPQRPLEGSPEGAAGIGSINAVRYRPTQFYPTVFQEGKYHAPSKISGNAMCGAPAELDLKAGPLTVDGATDPDRIHPLVCKRCLQKVVHKEAGVVDDALDMIQEGFDNGEVEESSVAWFAPTPAGQQIAHEMAFEGDLHDEPEPALPMTDGTEDDDDDGATPGDVPAVAMAAVAGASHVASSPAPGDASLAWLMNGSGATQADNADIAAQAKRFLKEGLKSFTPAEQRQIIDEGADTTAANLDRLDLAGTHYEALEAALAAAEEEDDTLWP